MEIGPSPKDSKVAPTAPLSRRALVPAPCPLTAALSAIGGKWSLICLYWLDSSTRRFNELRRLMPAISHKVLAETLRNLESEGLIRRVVHAEVPPRVEYSISAHGQTVRPLIEALSRYQKLMSKCPLKALSEPRLPYWPE